MHVNVAKGYTERQIDKLRPYMCGSVFYRPDALPVVQPRLTLLNSVSEETVDFQLSLTPKYSINLSSGLTAGFTHDFKPKLCLKQEFSLKAKVTQHMKRYIYTAR